MSRFLFRLKHALLIFWHRTLLRRPYITYRVRFIAHMDPNVTIKIRNVSDISDEQKAINERLYQAIHEQALKDYESTD